MTSRIGSPDTRADIQVRECLDEQPARSFVMVAGAGSGKTTSLVKALQHLAISRGPMLRRAGQQIACITYTEVAVAEISGDVGNAALFHVSTIHSFLWSLVRSFHADIKRWVADRIREKITEKEAHRDKPRTQARTRERLVQEIAELQGEIARVVDVERFTYGTGSDYAEGVLGHDDVLKLGPALIAAHPLLRQIVASHFPYIFVDESQDTNPTVVDALRCVASEQVRLCVGFFGDPMQKIYTTGAGAIALEPSWRDITKPENFRCPTSVLRVVNAIRAAGDGLEQTRGRAIEVDGVLQPVAGSAHMFVLPADENRTARLQAVRQWLRNATADPLWLSDNVEADVRLLVLVHRMAAARLGFSNIYAALHDKAPASLKDGLEDGTAWPLRPLLQFVLPLVMAARAGDQFKVMSLLRSACPLLEADRIQHQAVHDVLRRLQEAVDALVALLQGDSRASIGEVLTLIRDREMVRLDERFNAFLVPDPVDDGNSEFEHVIAFLACRAIELWGYRRYIEEESPFATQQGVKGAQFERVLVVLDDEEGAHSHFSYGKYFGFVPLSEKDEENIAAGVESVLDRTRRLFYVCCSRAVKDLAVVIFVPDVDQARAAVGRTNLFPADAIHGLGDIEGLA
ncbi:pathogenesis-like protein [Burkholderia pseudomallei]|nr:pathogenesis-like protein [Burkholderia pseudomallei]CAJ7296826.1 pathogenesis-like protein [Burkholderia pseudomallei]